MQLAFNHLIAIIVSILVVTPVFAQVNCFNGIDDDGDNLIDCYDDDCFTNDTCSAFFYGSSPECVDATPSLGINGLTAIITTTHTENDSRFTPIVGDIDADCVPEIITMSEGPDEVNVYDGITGELELTISPALQSENTWGALAIGDINNDGFGEILVINQSSRILAYSHLGVLIWTSSAALNKESSHVHIADFNGDGNPEVYCEDQIFNGQTGVRILAAGGNRGDQGGNNGQTIAADVLSDGSCADCSGLELIAGAEVYSIDIGGSSSNLELDVAGSLTRNNGNRGGTGYTSVADINADGDLDVVVGSLWNCSSTCRPIAFGYTPETGAMIGGSGAGFRMVDFTNQNTSGNMGRPLLVDLDGDGDLEIVLSAKDMMGVLDNTFTELWSRNDLNDNNSGQSTATAFDLNGDGQMEIIYRDQTDLLIINSATGATITSTVCFSQTRCEYPIVADVNIDGIADIITVCATASGADNGPVTVFNDDTDNWVSARSVMNQHGYNPTYVNDDLSIPSTLQGTSSVGMNNFLVQSPKINTAGGAVTEPLTDMGKVHHRIHSGQVQIVPRIVR